MSEDLVVLKDISRTYQKGKEKVEVLHRLDMTIEQGDFVALMGPSGSGKTTFLNIAGLLESPTSGSYLLDGEDVSRLSDREMSAIRNQKIGFIFQSFHLIPRLTAAQNVELPLTLAAVPRAARALAVHRL